jgi:hypothetical protein
MSIHDALIRAHDRSRSLAREQERRAKQKALFGPSDVLDPELFDLSDDCAEVDLIRNGLDRDTLYG